MSKARWSKAILLVAAAAGLLWLARPAPVDVEVAQVARGPLHSGFSEEARTRARHPFLLSAPVAGQMDRIDLEPGDPVRVGQELIRLRPQQAGLLDARSTAETEARLRAAQAATEAAERRALALGAERDEARREDARLAGMPHLVSVADRDRASSRMRSLESQHAAAVAEQRRARNEAQALVQVLEAGSSAAQGLGIPLNSPIDGRVLYRHLQSAQPVLPGQALLELAAWQDLEVESEVLSPDAVRLQVGGLVRLERWGGSEPLLARVRRIEPQGFRKVSALGVEEQRTRVYASFEPPLPAGHALGVGYAAIAWFELERWDDLLQVPGSAVVNEAGQTRVYRIRGDYAEAVPVEVVARTPLQVGVRGELREGEAVVAHPDDRVRAGARVRSVSVAP